MFWTVINKHALCHRRRKQDKLKQKLGREDHLLSSLAPSFPACLFGSSRGSTVTPSACTPTQMYFPRVGAHKAPKLARDPGGKWRNSPYYGSLNVLHRHPGNLMQSNSSPPGSNKPTQWLLWKSIWSQWSGKQRCGLERWVKEGSEAPRPILHFLFISYIFELQIPVRMWRWGQQVRQMNMASLDLCLYKMSNSSLGIKVNISQLTNLLN